MAGIRESPFSVPVARAVVSRKMPAFLDVLDEFLEQEFLVRVPPLPRRRRQGHSHGSHPGKGHGRHRQSGYQSVIWNGVVGT